MEEEEEISSIQQNFPGLAQKSLSFSSRTL